MSTGTSMATSENLGRRILPPITLLLRRLCWCCKNRRPNLLHKTTKRSVVAVYAILVELSTILESIICLPEHGIKKISTRAIKERIEGLSTHLKSVSNDTFFYIFLDWWNPLYYLSFVIVLGWKYEWICCKLFTLSLIYYEIFFSHKHWALISNSSLLSPSLHPLAIATVLQFGSLQ